MATGWWPGGMVLATNTQARFLLQGLRVTRGRRVEDLFRVRIAPRWLIDDSAIEALRSLPWFGNIRGLKAILTRLTLAGATGVMRMVTGLGGQANDPL